MPCSLPANSSKKSKTRALLPTGCAARTQKGRAYLDGEPEYRTSFQRDRDRILHTTAFRRLEYKTQVFINFEGDHFRTRLTHTLEVAQIGRTFARALGGNEDLVEAICLAHDLGHSPLWAFRRSRACTSDERFGGFDHNKQSLRIVTELEQRYPEFPGLNLTWEVREGMVKHESEYDISDARDFNPDLRGNLETQIANVADELAYTTHDLDDGLRSGMINPQMLEGVALWEILRETYNWRGPILGDMERHRMIRHLVGIMVTDMVKATDGRIKESKVTSAIDIQKLKHNVVGYSEEMQRRNRELKDLLYKKLYRHYRVVRMQVKAERIISDLFHAYRVRAAMLPNTSSSSSKSAGWNAPSAITLPV
jgi:dGTPase